MKTVFTKKTAQNLLLKSIFIFLIALCGRNSFSATFTVSSNADAGANTLRQALINANAVSGADIINFNFGMPTVITLATCLPQITGQITIDGYSDPGASAGNLMIQAIFPVSCKGFELAAGSDGSVIRGIVINASSTGVLGVSLHNSNNHVIKGNYFGTNITGTALSGTALQDCININTSINNTIGGTGGQIDRNIISGASQAGIRLANNSTGTIIINNYIGTDVTGNLNFGNTGNGIDGNSNSHNLRIGGTTLSERNVISGNHSNGIYLNFCQSPIVKGNIIGMGLDGTTKLGNLASGMDIENTGTIATAAQIGGLTVAERNYSSCNGAFGIVVRSAPGSVIQGNWLGVDMATGLLDYGNFDAAITATNTADLVVGGTVAGAGNICSASGNPGGGADGISIFLTSPRPIIKGNIIGFGVDGVTPLQNYGHGIECLTCDDGIIGGTSTLERNLISNSFLIGVQLVNSPRVKVINNYIGTDVTGMIDNGGTQLGIHVSSSANVEIGGTSTGTGNIISGNAQYGISVDGTSPAVLIKGNLIGLAVDGVTSIKNDQGGIQISNSNTGANNCVIGGTTTLERNVISSNGGDGINIGGGSSGHSILNNYIGTDVSGTIAKGNTGSGLILNTGGTATVDQNIFAANGGWGIELINISNNTITRNNIGTDVSGTLKFGNTKEGLRLAGTSSFNVSGGSLANANIITDNSGAAGVLVESTAQKNTITFNSIFCNAGPGITLQGAANESVPPPTILFSGTNSINGTGVTNDVIHIYRNVKADGAVKCDCEGEIYIGTVTVAAGVWSLTHNLGLTAAEAASATATQTTPLGSTSQFTPCSAPLPVALAYFTIVKNQAHTVSFSWSTASELNNHHFEILRSKDGIHFEVIGFIEGMGNSATINNYSFLDSNPFDGINYYQLKQIDNNGEASYSVVRSVDFSSTDIFIFPDANGFKIMVPGNQKNPVAYYVYSMTGILVAKGTVSIATGSSVVDVKLNLASAIYLVTATSDNNFMKEKIFIAEE